jgi:hypothetical protein
VNVALASLVRIRSINQINSHSCCLSFQNAFNQRINSAMRNNTPPTCRERYLCGFHGKCDLNER